MRFILVDRILRLDPAKEAVVLKNVANSEDFFRDHFPGRPIMPGCLILEVCDQAARLLLASSVRFTRLPILEGLSNAKFRHFVQPGDSMRVRVTLVSRTTSGADVRAAVSVGDRTVAQACLGYRLADSTENTETARICTRLRGFVQLLSTESMSADAGDPAHAIGQHRGTEDA